MTESSREVAATPKKASFKLLFVAWKQRDLFLLSLPALLALIIFSYIPMGGLVTAFKDFNFGDGMWRSPWSQPFWFYFNFLTEKQFWELFLNTFRIAFFRLIFSFPAPIILALLLNEFRAIWFKKIVQTVTYLPHFVSWVVVAGIMYQIFAMDGIFNELRRMVGLKPTLILAKNELFLPILIISGIYKEVGWGTIIYLAALAGVDPQLYEAAVIDGAGRVSQIRYITIPCIMNIISIVLVLSIPSLLSAGFDQIFNLMNPMVMKAADILDIYIIRQGIQRGQLSLTTAVGLFSGILGTTLLLTSNWVSKKTGGSGIW